MESSPIKYEYALDEKGVVQNINELSEVDRKDYKCLSCGNALRPVLPKERRKHFRHKSNHECQIETYLHRAGKMLFVGTYKNCLKQGLPYTIEYAVPEVCNFCTHGPCTINNRKTTYDLTKTFTSIEEEQIDNEFIPDILLKTKSEEKIYIEMVVTHKSSANKIDSKAKIIEFILDKEEDLLIFNQTEISFFNEKIKAINFNPKPIKIHFQNNCQEKVTYFSVLNNGKCKINTVAPFEFDRIQSNSSHYITKVKDKNSLLQKEAEKAPLKGVKVKNCYLCRYFILDSSFILSEALEVTYCELYESNKDSDMAVKCKHYCPDKNVFKYIKS